MPLIGSKDRLIVEGAGGVLVPINKTQLMIDLMGHLKLPVLLVARTSLGTINHTLLSLAALRSASARRSRRDLVGKYNRENLNAIEHYGDSASCGICSAARPPDQAITAESFPETF